MPCSLRLWKTPGFRHHGRYGLGRVDVSVYSAMLGFRLYMLFVILRSSTWTADRAALFLRPLVLAVTWSCCSPVKYRITDCQSIPRCSSCVKSAIKRIYTSGSFSDSASCLVQQQIQFMRQRYHLEVCVHEVPLVMSPVMQAMGWQNVHILVLLHVYEYSKKAVQELTGYHFERVPVVVSTATSACSVSVVLAAVLRG